MSSSVRKLLEGEESRLSVAGPGSVSAYSQAMFAAPSYGRTQISMQSAAPYLMSSRLYTSPLFTQETISASQAQRAEASPPQEEEEQDEEEDEQVEEEEEQVDEDAKEEEEEVQEEEKEEDAEEEEKEEEQAEEEQEVKEKEEDKQEEGEEEAAGDGWYGNLV